MNSRVYGSTGIAIYSCKCCGTRFTGRSAMGKHQKAEQKAREEEEKKKKKESEKENEGENAKENETDEGSPILHSKQDDTDDTVSVPSPPQVSYNATASSSTAPIYPHPQPPYAYQFTHTAQYPSYAPVSRRAYVSYSAPSYAYPPVVDAPAFVPETSDWNSGYLAQYNEEPFEMARMMADLYTMVDEGYISAALTFSAPSQLEECYLPSPVIPAHPLYHHDYPTYGATHPAVFQPTYFDTGFPSDVPPPYTCIDPAPAVPRRRSAQEATGGSEVADERPRKRQRKNPAAAARSTPYDRSQRRRRVDRASTAAPRSPTPPLPIAPVLQSPISPIAPITINPQAAARSAAPSLSPSCSRPVLVDPALMGPFSPRWSASPEPSLASSADGSDVDNLSTALVPAAYLPVDTNSLLLEEFLDSSLWN